MLTDLYVKNYTLVKHVHLSFEAGFSVISGETGAGKSLFIDCVSLALGRRAEANLVRPGEDTCEITLVFDVTELNDAKTWLISHAFLEDAADPECLITRRITAEGRSQLTLNGKPCPLSLIREFAKHVLLIHSQHDTQQLLNRSAQQQQLDALAGNQALLKQLGKKYTDWQENQNALNALKEEANTREDSLHLFSYQRDELLELAPQTGEWENLHQEHRLLTQGEDLVKALNKALTLTTDNKASPASTQIHEATLALHAFQHIPAIQDALETLKAASIHLQEATDGLNTYQNSLELSPERLQQVDRRLSLMSDLARKHRVTPDNLPSVLETIESKIQALKAIDERMDALKSGQTDTVKAYRQLAATLRQRRQTAAKKVSAAITDYMQTLGMQGGEFNVLLEEKESTLSPTGEESIVFLIRTNPGHPLNPLQKAASGGELSRISLVLQVLLSEKNKTPTLIFDEIDTGIGGKTATIVATLLRRLSQRAQIFCITHLPQVASFGHRHYLVKKMTVSAETTTKIHALSLSERVEELSRMLSGSSITDQVRQHAKTLLASAEVSA